MSFCLWSRAAYSGLRAVHQSLTSSGVQEGSGSCFPALTTSARGPRPEGRVVQAGDVVVDALQEHHRVLDLLHQAIDLILVGGEKQAEICADILVDLLSLIGLRDLDGAVRDGQSPRLRPGLPGS